MQKYLKQCKYTYNEDDLLGEGSFGKVFKGYNNHTQSEVALKQIELSKLEKGEDMLKTILLSEITVMRKFNRKMKQDPCPFLVRQEDVFRTDKHIYIVMEVCMGGTLEDEIRGKRFKEKECIEVLYCISKGLEYMGEMGISHRDLKPENIFISSVKLGQGQGKETKIYKIGDFGFAAQKQEFDIAMGTVPFMAPEMFKKQKYNNKVDVWSLGIIAYQIMYGALYFVGKNTHEFKKNILQKPFGLTEKQKNKAGANYQDFMIRCLNKQAKYRLGVDQLLMHPLFADIHKQLASIHATVFESEKMKEPDIKKMVSEESNKGDEEKIFEETEAKPAQKLQQIPKPVQKQPDQPQVQQPSADAPTVAFAKLTHLLQQCTKMRSLAEQFHNFQQQTKRMTEFVQVYLLKDAYAMMNRLTYSVMHKQNHIQFDQQEFAIIIDPQHQAQYQELYDRCVKQCTWTTGLFNQKYKWFTTQYINKFQEDDRELIKGVINEEPYEYVNGQVLEKELRKWMYIFAQDQENGGKKYGKWKNLGAQCQRILQIRLKG